MEQAIQQIQKLNVMVRDRTGVLYQGTADAVSSYNDTGPFDILPMHANFICLILNNLTIHISNTEEKKIPVQVGVLKIKRNTVEIYLGIIR